MDTIEFSESRTLSAKLIWNRLKSCEIYESYFSFDKQMMASPLRARDPRSFNSPELVSTKPKNRSAKLRRLMPTRLRTLGCKLVFVKLLFWDSLKLSAFKDKHLYSFIT